MIVLTVLMYCMSTVHIALALQVNLIAFFDQHAIEGGLTILDEQGDALVWVQIMLELLNVGCPAFSSYVMLTSSPDQCLMGDSIVCWRTWVLWGRDYRVLIFPGLCITGGLGESLHCPGPVRIRADFGFPRDASVWHRHDCRARPFPAWGRALCWKHHHLVLFLRRVDVCCERLFHRDDFLESLVSRNSP